MAKPFTPSPHPVLGLPTPAQMTALGKERWAQLMVEREQRIAKERAEPFPHWYEAPIWKVCDALLGFPWVDADWAELMRRHLGFARPVKVMLINGGNRGSKSEYASDRVMRVLRILRRYQPERTLPARAWCLHSTLQMSRDYQQSLFWNYLPPELKAKDYKTRVTYIAYKQKTGFSDEKFVLPDGADNLFKAYEQDRKGIEGGNVDIIWPDELVPSDWVETMELRIAELGGWMIITFTPVEGYTETVRLFQDGAEVVKESVAFLLPRDGGAPDEARALGLTDAELDEIKRADRDGRAALVPQCRPENCDLWIAPHPDPLPIPQTAAGRGEGTAIGNPVNAGQLPIPAGREFETVPRVMKCVSQNTDQPRACVFFHTSDNPYGNPKSVYATIAGKHVDFKRERFYGVATKNFSARFPKFNLKVHVIRPESVPAEGTNYLFVDPAGRNFFMGWFRVTARGIYLYREWPGNYYIHGVGVPGAWALPDGKHPDGRRGPAQKAFGWGHMDYKLELARLEAWNDYRANRPDGMPEAEWLEKQREWDPDNGVREAIQERFMDSRFGSTPKLENDRPVTLIEEFAELHLAFTPTPGDDIEEGVQLIQNALAYDSERPVDFFNQPQLQISSDCPNTIYALQTWTGFTREGRRNLEGATKDPIDLLRYFFLSDCAYLGSGADKEEEETESEFVTAPKAYY